MKRIILLFPLFYIPAITCPSAAGGADAAPVDSISRFAANMQQNQPLIAAIVSGDESKIKSLVVNKYNSSLKEEGWVIVFSPNGKIAILLHQYGASYTAQLAQGVNLLMAATMDNQFDLVKFAVENGVSVNSKDHGGWTPLFFGTDIPVFNLDIANYLVKNGALVNEQNSQGETVLIKAADRGDLEFVKWLLSHGADPRIPDSKGKTPRDYALNPTQGPADKEVYPEIVRLLDEAMNPPVNP